MVAHDPAEPKKPDKLDQDTVRSLHELEGLRVNIADKISKYFNPLFAVTIAFAIFLCAIIGTRLSPPTSSRRWPWRPPCNSPLAWYWLRLCLPRSDDDLVRDRRLLHLRREATFGGKLDSGGLKGEVSLKNASPGLLFARRNRPDRSLPLQAYRVQGNRRIAHPRRKANESTEFAR